jgi:hypothetical protein
MAERIFTPEFEKRIANKSEPPDEWRLPTEAELREHEARARAANEEVAERELGLMLIDEGIPQTTRDGAAKFLRDNGVPVDEIIGKAKGLG